MTSDSDPTRRRTEPAHVEFVAEDGAGPSYEQARDELVAIVAKLESGGAGLEESLALWERGERLATICQDFLDGATARVEAARTTPGDAED